MFSIGRKEEEAIYSESESLNRFLEAETIPQNSALQCLVRGRGQTDQFIH